MIKILISINKIILVSILVITSFILCSIQQYALSPTPKADTTATPQPSNEIPKSDDIEKIQRIKDRVASKVAELNLVEKRGIIGKIREVSNMKIAVDDIKGAIRQIDIDELTKFNISKNITGISDLKKGNSYSFIGIYNKDTKRLLARVIGSTASVPSFFEGALLDTDSKKYQLTLVNDKGETKKVDIENSTKTNLADSDGDLVKSGFSKLEINKRILAIGFTDDKDDSLLTALRVIHFDSIPPSKEMQSHIKLDK